MRRSSGRRMLGIEVGMVPRLLEHADDANLRRGPQNRHDPSTLVRFNRIRPSLPLGSALAEGNQGPAASIPISGSR